jgi:hypothetical protein
MSMTNVRNALGLIASAVLAGVVVSCGGGGGGGSEPPAPATVVRSASLTFAQEVPVPTVASTATGRGAVVVNPTTLEITGGITFTGLTGNPTAAHIHTGAVGVSGPPNVVTLTLSSDNATATVPLDTKLSPAQYTSLLAGELYFNVHTTANANGEIRGQITGTTGVTAGLASLTGAQENSTNTSTATGRGTIVFDSATREILICYVTHNVTNSTVAHIHTGAPGVSGAPNVVDLSAILGPIRTAPVPTTLSAQAVTDLTAGNTYFNVHSTNNLCAPAATCAAGEIRGQIAVQ